ncbi:hypothetical protein GCM10010124_12730 [Pilimelia terevasa]|uniref:Prepilin-type N-terminal cleavage/methylation domain-containing protein n=1 Tax=Pilimelia terevasa TaxID=53372 RepID=A0A8J3BHI4_9ACTN|nr:prepilin-type N-terminal cleavage/methylation domain-containing protein [Pilimelia terevasa]GGK21689.1 hypothetical protein GCM10010124_12730 [Pilimelia terevasa]
MTALPPDRRDDAGVTLVEVLVGLGLMAVVMVVFTSGIVAAMRVARGNEAIADAQAQVSRAFTRLDTELRYAAQAKSPNAEVDGVQRPRLEYVVNAAGTGQCYRVWLDGGTLYRQSWSASGTPPPPAPQVLAVNVGRIEDEPVFEVVESETEGMPATVRLALAVTAGGAAHQSVRQLRQDFYLPNTLTQAPAAEDGAPGRANLDTCEDLLGFS